MLPQARSGRAFHLIQPGERGAKHGLGISLAAFGRSLLGIIVPGFAPRVKTCIVVARYGLVIAIPARFQRKFEPCNEFGKREDFEWFGRHCERGGLNFLFGFLVRLGFVVRPIASSSWACRDEGGVEDSAAVIVVVFVAEG